MTCHLTHTECEFVSLPSLSGTLQIRYNLGGLKEPFVISLDHRNMANGQPHSVNISRHDRLVYLQVRNRSQLNANTDDR